MPRERIVYERFCSELLRLDGDGVAHSKFVRLDDKLSAGGDIRRVLLRRSINDKNVFSCFKELVYGGIGTAWLMIRALISGS